MPRPRFRTLLALHCLLLGSQSGQFARAQASPSPDSEPGAAVSPTAPGKRVPWTTSRVTGTPEPGSPYLAERVFGQLEFKSPVDLTDAPGSDRMFVLQQDGVIYSWTNHPDTGSSGQTPQPDLFLDMPAAIPGMTAAYGLTFHPDFKNNGYCYLCYVLESGRQDGTRISRFEVEPGDPPQVKPNSEQILLTFLSGGHNGACLKFGPDGYLYISTGDGEAPFPPDRLLTGQDISDLLSSILRIDVDRPDGDRPYSSPADNPFVSLTGARPEVWAYGFRNPWRMSFDFATGELWVGDVGWELWELVYRVERGGNYGWAVMEGSQPVLTEGKRGPTPIIPPIVEHSHTESRSITGGYVYRGRRLPELTGAYIYGDYETGKIWGLRCDGPEVIWRQELVDTTIKIVSFATDRDGELYVLDHQGGIFQLTPNPNQGPNEQFPRLLSETGLFESLNPLTPAPGVVPYGVIAEPWADGAVATRHVGLPGESRIDPAGAAFRFPAGTVLTKTIAWPGNTEGLTSPTQLETQVLHFDGLDWRAYTYIWNEDQTDATLADADGSERTLTIADRDAPEGRRQQTWKFFSRAQCVLCHNTMAGSVLGFTPAQLDADHAQPAESTSRLSTLIQTGIFSETLAEDLPTLVNPGEASAELDRRARSYLHANCAHCHRRHGGGTAAIELLHDLPLESTNALGVRPTQGAFGIYGAQVVSPGDPYGSVLYYRMSKLGRGHMPHLGAGQIDPAGLDLIHEWISKLPSGADASGSGNPRPESDESSQWLADLGKSDAPTDDVAAALARLLGSTRGALALSRAIGDGSLGSEAGRRAAQAGLLHADPQVSGLFERFVPEQLRPQRLGSAIRPEQILSLAGDADRGRRLFFETAAVQCKNCHRVRDQGVALGPDLTQVGKKLNRGQLLETILEPSKQIDPKFMAYVVETTDGLVLTGLLAERSEQEVVIKDSQNKLIRVPTQEVELLAPQQKSLMPELLLRDMTAQEVADLLEFLGDLK